MKDRYLQGMRGPNTPQVCVSILFVGYLLMQGQYYCSVPFVARPTNWRSAFEPDPQQARKAFNISTWLYGSVGYHFVLHCGHPQLRWLGGRSVSTRIRRGCILCENPSTCFLDIC